MKYRLTKRQWLIFTLGVIAVFNFVIVIIKGWPWYFAVGIMVGAFGCFNAIGRTQNRQKIEAHFSDRPVLGETEFGERYFSTDRAQIAAKLREILVRHVDIDLSRMNPTDRFIEDLRMDDFDSMATVDYVIAIEKEFGIKIPDTVAEKITTFQSLVDYVSEAIKAK